MYAIIESGGKQFTVEEGDTIEVELLPGEKGQEVVFDKVLYVGGDAPVVGDTACATYVVKGVLEDEVKGKKIGRDWFTTHKAIDEYLQLGIKPGPKARE